MIQLRLIRQPTDDTAELLKTRLWRGTKEKFDGFQFDTIGLIQGYVIEMLAASDVVGKAAPVQVAEVLGLCPQHFSLLGVFGTSEAVDTAMSAVEQQLGGQWLGADRRRSAATAGGN
ncbi:MAG: hypothetical protein QGH66_01870 [Dehalococcoidia bacterium]|nr:hypothetical protein [Dehalococcoidia bacterium]MDP7469429.1 hypothetical protein [Dehalococcoidia bacterium]